LWLHSLKVAQLLRSAACLHTNQSRSYLNHLAFCPICVKMFHLHIPVKYESSTVCNNYKVANYYLATSNSFILSCKAIVLSCSICGNCRNLNGTMLSIDVTMPVWNITNRKCLFNNT